MAARNYYEILGSPEDASQEEIERLYKRLATKHHPDRGGDPEEMKSINAAYEVLGNANRRRTYDSERRSAHETLRSVEPPFCQPSMVVPTNFSGSLIGALFTLLGGLVFLFLVRIYYLRFMWPIFLLAVLIVLVGVWKIHEAMIVARKNLPSSHLVRRYGWAQEIAFWGIVGVGGYTIYLLMIAI